MGHRRPGRLLAPSTMTVAAEHAVCPNSEPGTGDDCDDTLPTCTTRCELNSDGDGVPDCVERFCGSDVNGGSTCVVAADRTQLDAAISAANEDQGQGPFFFLLEDMQVNDGFTTIATDEGVTIGQRPGAELRLNAGGDKDVFTVTGDNVTFEGIHFVNVNNARQWIQTTGDSTTVRRCVFEGWEFGAVWMKNATGTRIVDNVIANVTAGVHVKGAAGLVSDHNTCADFSVRGVSFYGAASADVCVCSNIVADPTEPIMIFDQTVTWDECPECVGALDSGGGDGPLYGNCAPAGGQLCSGDCEGATAAECSACLPSAGATGWELDVDPSFATSTVGHAGFYCPQNSALIDSGDSLAPGDPDYDRNGDAPGEHSGSAPDIGGRETGTPECGG